MADTKPKMLVLTTTFPRWKDDTDPPFVYELSKRLTSSFDVVVHTPHYHGSLVDEEMEGVQVHRFRYFFSRFETLAGGQGIVPKLRKQKAYFLLLPIFLLAQLFSLLLLVSKQKPDIIHAHWLIPQGLWATGVKKIFGIPVVITAHGADVFALRSPLLLRLKSWIFESVNAVVPVSKALANVLCADTQINKRTVIIPMGVDSSLFFPEKRTTTIKDRFGIKGPFLLFVGRLTEKKGVGYLIDAMVSVNTMYPDAKLIIVGKGELEQELRTKVEQKNLLGIVEFAGAVPNADLPAYYATADLFIGPSVQVQGGDTEGFGLTFVEALMSGCIVIGTDVGGIEDIIQHGQTGYIVSAAKSSLLAKAILHALKLKDKNYYIKKQGRERAVEKFEWEIVALRYENIIKNLIDSNG